MAKTTLISIVSVIDSDQVIHQASLKRLHTHLKKKFSHFEIILVGNGISAKTQIETQRLVKSMSNIRCIVLSKKYDIEIAYIAGLENSIGDFVVIKHLEYDTPELAILLIENALRGTDIVIAKADHRGDGLAYRSLRNVLYRISYFLTGYAIDPDWSNFTCFSRRAVNAILQIKNNNRYIKFMNVETGYEPKILDHIASSAFPVKKKSIFALFDIMSVIVDHSNKLLKIAVKLSFFIGLVNLAYIGYIILVNIFKKNVAEGWTTISFTFSVMFSCLFIILAIFGEYMSYIYEEIKKGPLYHIAYEMTGQSELGKTIKSNVSR
jgi:hypothetical protein